MSNEHDEDNAQESSSAELDAEKPNAAATPQSAQSAAEFTTAIQEMRTSLSNISSELRAIKSYVARKDEELRQWQDGYDWAKRKELLGEYANWLDYLGRREKNSSLSAATRSEVKSMREIMELTMENFSLEIIRPSKGEDFTAWRGRAEIFESVETTNASDHGKIAELVSSGIQYRKGERAEDGTVIRLAQVRVWRKLSTT